MTLKIINAGDDASILKTYIENQKKSKVSIARDLGMSRRNLYGIFESKFLEESTKEKFENYFGEKIFTVEAYNKLESHLPANEERSIRATSNYWTSKRLNALRKDWNFTIEFFSNLLSISTYRLVRLEKGEFHLTPKDCDALDTIQNRLKDIEEHNIDQEYWSGIFNSLKYGILVKRYRTENGLSLKDLSTITQLPEEMIDNIERFGPFGGDHDDFLDSGAKKLLAACKITTEIGNELPDLLTPPTINSTQHYLESRRKLKTNNGIPTAPLIPAKAQAGYVRAIDQQQYMDTLEKFALPPGVDPMGANWAYWEVEGDSMEPAIKSGDIILTSQVHSMDWENIRNFYVYVIVTEDMVLVKRVFAKNLSEWVLISENEALYPQALIAVKSVKQVWVFRRRIEAAAPPTKVFKITV